MDGTRWYWAELGLDAKRQEGSSQKRIDASSSCFPFPRKLTPPPFCSLLDLRANDVDVVTFGQYMRPSKKHMKVERYVEPAEFAKWKEVAEGMGFLYVASGPLVRSSYKVRLSFSWIVFRCWARGGRRLGGRGERGRRGESKDASDSLFLRFSSPFLRSWSLYKRQVNFSWRRRCLNDERMLE